MAKRIRICILAASIICISGVLFSQPSSPAQPSAPASSVSSVQSQKAPERNVAKPNESHPPDNAEAEEENAQFKYGWAVKGLAAKTGLSKEAVYWIFTIINFAILFAGLVWIVKKLLPNGFAPRVAEIRKGIEEARKASAEASARLSEIEGRLARLDAEIAEIRTAAEADFSVEEQRIKAAAEQDAKNVVVSAEQEIAAAARIAQRELKSFVADLAVGLAEKKIKVDDATDQALVRGFAARLGKDK